jgi:cellulose synthase/poly-beta-1,6-N-acetylglucosamine synthase-like glycosyltransferase
MNANNFGADNLRMIDLTEPHTYGLMGAALFGLALAIQLFLLLFRFLKTGNHSVVAEQAMHPVSIVIAARNEEKNLLENIPKIMAQKHPNFEVIIVNDSSWDDTADVLKALSLSYPQLHVIHIDEEKQNMQGKKFAITLGIKAAKHDIILLTDADCEPASEHWITEMTKGLSDSKQLSIGFSPYARTEGWLNRLIRFDTLLIGCQYMGFARSGAPYMGVGRNLAYHKDLFFKIGGFKSHYSIASGDDDLFVNQVATGKNTWVVSTPESQTISEPKHSWNAWFTQKRRHFTTSGMYKTSHKLMLSIWPLSFAILMLAGIVALYFHTYTLFIIGGLVFRYSLQIAILHRVSRRLDVSRDVAWLSPALEIQMHAINLGLYFINLLRKPKKWN